MTNIEVYRGSREQKSIKVKGDYTGYDNSFVVKEYREPVTGDRLICKTDIETTYSNGYTTFSFWLEVVDTEELVGKNYVWDLDVIDPDDHTKRTTVDNGNLILLPDVQTSYDGTNLPEHAKRYIPYYPENFNDTEILQYDDELGEFKGKIPGELVDENFYNKTEINSKELALQQADSTLQDNIDAEELARQQADSTLQQNINLEAGARASGDSALSDAIQAVATDLSENYHDKIAIAEIVEGVTEDMTDALSTKVDKVIGKQLSTNDFTDQLKNKLDNIEEQANRYVHPETHPASIIVQDENNRFVTDNEKNYWDNKSELSLGETSSTAYRGDRGKTAYDHSQTTGNPHGTSKDNVGLGNVPNLDTTDAVNNQHTHSNKSTLDLIDQNLGTSHTPSFTGLGLTGDVGFSGANRNIGTTSNHTLSFRTNNVVRLTIDTSGITTLNSISSLESSPLGSELLNSDGWDTTGWSGDFATGFTHIPGNTTSLTNTLAAVNGNLYQVAFSVTGRTAGSFTINFGSELSNTTFTATTAWGVKATGTGTLSINPTTDFDGKIVLSIKQITGTYSAVYVIKDSSGSNVFEIRSSLASLANVFIGLAAGRGNTTGYNCVAVGALALQNNTTGNSCVAVGRSALQNNTTGNNCVAVGTSALRNNTTGNICVAVGALALYSNTTGYNCTAVGALALYSNTTGYNCVAVGTLALQNNTTGNICVAVGALALQNNTTGNNCTAVGASALQSNTTGNNCTAVGASALQNNTTGYNCVAVGASALRNNTTGINCTAVGINSGRYLADGSTGRTTGNNSTYIGSETKASADGTNNENVFGYGATGSGSNTITFGDTNITKHVFPSGDVILNSAKGFYFGDETTNGSWRIVRSSNDLVIQRRESDNWVTKQTIGA